LGSMHPTSPLPVVSRSLKWMDNAAS
jgi:hypothetical protein